MSDLISRQDAIKRFGEDGTWLEHQGVTTLTMVEAKQRAVDILESLPSADRPTGEWIFNPKDAIELMFTLPKCSECGFESSDCGNYCPSCGAKMKGADDED